nr:hypothetical protein [uncultured Allomuricauda sp.]
MLRKNELKIMNFNLPQLKSLIPVLLLLFLFSCSQETDLFNEVIQESIDEQIANDESEENPGDEEEEPNVDTEVSSELKAFPSAFGAGAYTTGGRGGRVIHVTTLNDGGPGSLRAAVGATGPRIIVFDVSGTIVLEDNLFLQDGDMTIAGQTAPEGGITLAGGGIYLMNSSFYPDINNIIIRYIRIRSDFLRNSTQMGILVNNVQNLILDHVSISWAGDKAIGIHDVSSNVTVQNCLLGESNTGMIMGTSLEPYTGVRTHRSNNMSTLRNIIYDSSHRFPNVSGMGRHDVINNVGYNFRFKLSHVVGEVKLNMIGNYYDRGEIQASERSLNYYAGNDAVDYSNVGIHMDGNVVKDYDLTSQWDFWVTFSNNDNPWKYNGTTYRLYDNLSESDFREVNRFELLGPSYDVLESEGLLDNLLQDIGSNKTLDENGNAVFNLDVVDQRFVTNMENRFYSGYNWNEDWKTYHHYNDYWSTVNTTPFNTRDSNYDSDLDGMPNKWEIANGLDPNNPDDGNGDIDGDGYTNIEEFLNSVDF